MYPATFDTVLHAFYLTRLPGWVGESRQLPLLRESRQLTLLETRFCIRSEGISPLFAAFGMCFNTVTSWVDVAKIHNCGLYV